MAIGTGAALIGSALIGGVVASSAAGEQAGAIEGASREGIAEQQAAREAFFQRTQPFVDIGTSAGTQLQNLLSDPSAGLEEINPIVDILRNQGFEQIQESAAAQGRLGSGGTLKDLTRFNTDLATTVVPQLQNQRFNQLFNVLGLGANAATGQGTAALSTASNVSNLLGNIGQARGNEAVNRANVITGAIGNVAQAFGGQQATNDLIQSDVSNVLSGDLF